MAKRLNRCLLFLLLLAGMASGAGAAHGAPAQGFFDAVSRPPGSPADPLAKRDRFVKIHTEMLEAIRAEPIRPGSRPQIHLNLFDNSDYTMVMDRQENRPKGRTVFSGHLQGVPGSIGVLTHKNGMVTGLFYIPGKGSFKILPGPNGTHRVIEVDTEKAAQCGDDPSHPELTDPKLAAEIPQEGMPNLIPLNYPAGCAFALNPTVLNLAVVYTPAALAVVGSAEAMESLIDTVVFYNNMVYFNSGINAQMQLVYSGEIAYTEKGSMYTDLPNMANGTIPAVQAIQSTYGAVIVNMLVAGSDPVMGLGDLPGHYSMEYVTFAEAMIHEMGHNLGCGHDTANGGPGVYSYSSGNRFTSQGVQYRTIMAYAPGAYTPYFSSPLATYLGVLTGGATTDNVRTINQTAPAMAASIPPASGLDVPTINVTSPAAGSVFTGPVTITLSANAADTAGIAQVDFYADSLYIGSATSAPYNLSWPQAPSGSHFITAHAINSLGTATFSCPVSLYVNPTLPSPWVDQDIGWLMMTTTSPLELKYMGIWGSANFSGGTYTVNGAGAGLGMNVGGVEQDSFDFVSQPSCGFSTLSARLSVLQNGSPNSQVGLMFRDSATNDSPYVFVGLDNGNQVVLASRATQGGLSKIMGGAGLSAPVWFQLQRSGNVFTGFESLDGATWNKVGAVTITMGANAGMGFAVSSMSDTVLTSATFDNVSATISCSPPTPTFTFTPTITPTPTWTSTITFTPTITFTSSTNTPTPTCAPGTGPSLTWSLKATMPTARDRVAMGSVNGILYAVGGQNGTSNALTTVEAYNPATNSWSTMAPMPTGREDLAVETVNGILYAIGGYTGAAVLSTVQAYNPATNSWSTLASMPTARCNLSVAVVNGIIYAVGGNNAAATPLGTVEAYNPATNSWTTGLAAMPTARSQFAVGVVNGIIYAAGGNTSASLTSPGTVVGTLESYDPVANSWTPGLAPMITARECTSGGSMNGLFYVVGGVTSTTIVNTAETYDPLANSWTTQASMTNVQSAQGGGVMNGVYYSVGGWSGSAFMNANQVGSLVCTAFTLTPTPTITSTPTPTCGPGTGPNLAWSTKSSLPSARYGLGAGVINGLLYAAGGNTNLTGTFTNAFQSYNPATNSWATLSSMPYALYGLGTGVANGKLYTFGGYINSSPSVGVTNFTQVYDPALNSWNILPPMPTPRYLLAVGTVNGVLYAIGGNGTSGSDTNTVEAYDPAANSWSTKSPMPTSREAMAAGVINNILYVAGGFAGAAELSVVEAYDPSTDSWSTKAPLPYPVDGGVGGVINGILYVAGGEDKNNNFLNTVEAYDPGTNSWSIKNPMPTARGFACGGVVNGVFYVVGGYNYNTSTLYATNEAASIVCAAFTPTSTPTPTGSPTPTMTFSYTPTLTPTNTGTPTPTITNTWTYSFTPTYSPTFTLSPTNTYPPGTNTPTPANTATFTATFTPTLTYSFTPTYTGTSTPTPTATPTGTWYTSTPTNTSTQILDGPQATVTPTNSPTITPTFTSTDSPTITLTFTPTLTATMSPTNSATNSPTLTPSLTPTNSPVNTSTPTPTGSFTYTSTPTFTNTSTDSDTPTPTNSLTFTPTATNTSTNSFTATNTLTGTFSPTNTSTVTATFTPTFTATVTPTPTGIIISPPYPNPVPGNGTVYFNVLAGAGSTVTFDIFTTAFRRIAWNSRTISGSALLSWDLKDQWNSPTASGLYYLRVKISGPVTATKILKILIQR